MSAASACLAEPRPLSAGVVVLLEQQLLTRHCAGDPKAFPELVERYRRPVASYLARCGIDPAAREDLCQEIFLKIHAGAPAYQPVRPLRVWIFTIIANTARSYFRKQSTLGKVVDARSAATGISGDPTAQSVAEAVEMQAYVQAELEKLPLQQREVIVLRCIHNLEHIEIGEVLGIPVNTAKTLLRRARLSLAKALSRRRVQERREVAR